MNANCKPFHLQDVDHPLIANSSLLTANKKTPVTVCYIDTEDKKCDRESLPCSEGEMVVRFGGRGGSGRTAAITHDLYGNVTRALPINICECVGSVSKMN